MSSGQVTAKDNRYAELRKEGKTHVKAWREAYSTKVPAIDAVPDHVRALVCGDSEEEFAEAHEIASNHELKVFWTTIMRDPNTSTAMRISAASELAKAKGVFAVASRKKPVEDKGLTPEQLQQKIAALLKERKETDE